MPDKGGVAKALAQRLQTKGVEVLRIEDAPRCRSADQSPQELAGRRSGARSLLAVRAGQRRTHLASMDLAAWHEALAGSRRSRFTPPCAFCTSRLRRRAHSWCRRHGLADSTATTKPERSRRWVARSWASPRRISGSALDALVKAVDFEADAQGIGSRRTPHRGNPARSRRSRDRLQGRASAGRLDCKNSPRPTASPV